MATTPSLDTLEKVSAKSGVGYGTVRRIKNGDVSATIDNLASIAAAFGLDIDEFLRTDEHAPEARPPSPTNTVPAVEDEAAEYARNPVVFHRSPSRPPFYDVPIFKLEDLHVARDIIDDLPADQPRTLSTVGGPTIVAAHMNDDSMTKPDGTGVPSGTLMFIDLEESPRVGHLVVVRMADGLCYLRQLVSDAGRWRLMPLNPKYDPAPAPEDRSAYIGVLKHTRIERAWTQE